MAKKKRTRRLAAVGGTARLVRKTFDGLAIVDADADFTLVVRTADIKAAGNNRKDPANCALAKACANQLGSSKVLFFRSVAYVEMPDSKGVRRVVRFMLSNDAAAVVRAFDRGQNVKGEVTVCLKAPANSQTLDELMKKERRGREKRNERRRAMIRGTITGDEKSSVGIFKKPRIVDMDVRSGQGRVQNSFKRAAADRVGA